MNGWRIVRAPVAWGRKLGLGRNALRRPVDRLESVALVAAIAVALLSVPFALMAGTAVQRANLAEMATQTATNHQTTAVLVQDAPANSGLDAGLAKEAALGRWRTPSGVERTGQVLAIPGEKAGTPVTVWINDAGQSVDQPLTPDQAYWRGVIAAIMIMVGAVLALGGALAVVRWRLNRRRYSAWDADWRDTEPRWTQRAR
jgi:hypothetical protein